MVNYKAIQTESLTKIIADENENEKVKEAAMIWLANLDDEGGISESIYRTYTGAQMAYRSIQNSRPIATEIIRRSGLKCE